MFMIQVILLGLSLDANSLKTLLKKEDLGVIRVSRSAGWANITNCCYSMVKSQIINCLRDQILTLPFTLVQNLRVWQFETLLSHPSHQTLKGLDLLHPRLLEIESEQQGPLF